MTDCHKILFRKIEGYICSDDKSLPKDATFVYGIRHSDSNDYLPATIEPFVKVNRWGTLVTKTELTFRKDKDYIPLKSSEKQDFVQALDSAVPMNPSKMLFK